MNKKETEKKDKFKKLCDCENGAKKTLKTLGIVFKFSLLHSDPQNMVKEFDVQTGIQFVRFWVNYTVVPDVGHFDK